MRTTAAPLPVQLHSVPQQVFSAELVAANARLLTQRSQGTVTRETQANGWLSSLSKVANHTAQPAPQLSKQSNKTYQQHITAYPDILLAILKNELATVGRIWLLARLIDVAGQGWLTITQLREALTSSKSSLRVCGWRRLRQLLQAGQGIFWQRDDRNRLWLRGTSSVAAYFKISKLVARPVQLPVASLLSSVSAVKANFYASFHSSRQFEGAYANPVSRDTLVATTGVSKRSQARYDQQVKIDKRQSLAVGGTYSAENKQTLAWQGKRTFKFTDSRGDLGTPGTSYIAWHLPNRYGTAHQSIAKRQNTKNINRRLRTYEQHRTKNLSETEQNHSLETAHKKMSTADLVAIRERGNGDRQSHAQLFFTNGKALSRKNGVRYWACSEAHVWREYTDNKGGGK